MTPPAVDPTPGFSNAPTVSEVGENSAKVSVTGVNLSSATNGIIFHCTPTAGGSKITKAATSVSDNTATATLSGLTAGTSYTLYASCSTTAGAEIKSSETRFTTVAPTPSFGTPSVSAVGETTATATVSGTNFAYLADGVTFHYVPVAGGTARSKTATVSGSNATASLTGLTAGTSYRLYATGTGTNGESAQSATIEFTTNASEPEQPSGTPALNLSWLEVPAAMTGSEMGGVTTSDLFYHTFYYGSESASNRNYTVCYDKGKLTTYWVAYPLNSSHLGSTGRTNKWAYVSSSLLSEDCQPYVKTSFYDAPSSTTNNYSKGHLLPSASRTNGTAMNEQTFLSVNLVPQIQSNFNLGVWSDLESSLQTKAAEKDLFVVTGSALQKGSDEEIGTMERTWDTKGKEISVPRYFYKVILKVNSTTNPTSASAIGFWFTNKSYTGVKFDSFAVSVDEIEQKLGIDFFPNLSDSLEKSAEANKSWSDFSNF